MKGRLRELVARSEVSYGCFITLSDPAVVEVAAIVGYDFVIIDLEHGAIGIETLCNHLRAAESRNLGTLVRVRSANAWDVLPVLEAGAQGVLVPHVYDEEAARRAAAAVRYAPLGQRGVYDAVRAGDYGLRVDGGYRALTDSANERMVLAVLIEDGEGIANAERIVAVPGVDVVLVGPADLSYSLGLGGTVGHPEVVAAIHQVRDICAKQGVLFSVPPDHDVCPISSEVLRAWGVRLIMRGSDTNALSQGMGMRLERMRGSRG